MSDIIEGASPLGGQPLAPSAENAEDLKAAALAAAKVASVSALTASVTALEQQLDGLPMTGPYDVLRQSRSALAFCIGQLKQHLNQIGA